MPYLNHKPLSFYKIKKFLESDPEAKVKIYTRQDPKGWEEAQQRGYLTGSHSAKYELNDFEYAYEWMRSQMAKRIPGFSGDLPVWGWLNRQNERKWKNSWIVKDRTIEPTFPRIIASVPRKRILASCYELWHFHLNNWHIALSPQHEEDFDVSYPRNFGPGENAEYQNKVEENWEKVFDIGTPRSGYELEGYGKIDIVQACVDRIYLDEIDSIKWD